MSARARELLIAVAIVLAIVGSVGFMVAFVLREDIHWQGAALALAFVGFMLAAIGWSRWILPREQVVEERHVGAPSTDAANAALLGVVRQAHHDISVLNRKKWLSRMLLAAVGLFGLAALFPIASLGPEPDDTLFHTKWRRGSRLQRLDGSFVKQSDLNVGAMETVFPEGNFDDAQSVAMILRLPDGVGRDALNGYIAYSKVCTHAGCPVALYRAADQKLVCPCHQSVFDAAADAAVLEGPADHALPRLPLQISDDGYVRADGDFPEPVGPGFWEHA
jgi:ubiquinol-cytochrome c reductase iron-sulfur subunit